jgi:dihydropteroate synthase
VTNYLVGRLAQCAQAGIPRQRVALDPGFGFGKTVEHNATLMRGLPKLAQLGCPLLIGFSRKSTIAKISQGEPADQRLPGSIAGMLFAVTRGASIVRVHDVAASRQALAVWQALEGTGQTR